MMNPNGEQEFSNVNPVQNTPTVAQPATAANSQRIKFNREYLFSLNGILRLLIIIFQFCAWVSAAAVPVLVSGTYYMPADFASTRSAYLFFSIIGFLFGIMIYVSYLMNLVNLNKINRIPWTLILLIMDVIWMISMFVLAIVAAVKEASIKTQNVQYINNLNIGAFGSAAFFGFLLSIIYGILAAIALIKIVKRGVSTPAYTP